jgi:hypothetical protein
LENNQKYYSLALTGGREGPGAVVGKELGMISPNISLGSR